MPSIQFKGKSVIETYHHRVAHHRLELDAKLSVLPRGEAPGLDGNLIIEGDNLLALKPPSDSRRKGEYRPPYNTGNEGWVYNDNDAAPVQGMDQSRATTVVLHDVPAARAPAQSLLRSGSRSTTTGASSRD